MAMVEGSNRRFSATGSTTRPEKVWLLWTDPATWGHWDTGLRSALLDGPFIAGARGQLVDLAGRTSTFVVEHVTPGATCSYRVALLGASLVVRRSLETTAGTVRHDVAFTGAVAPLWAAVLGRGFRAQIGVTVDALIAQADR